jgi:zinc transporter 2
MFITAVLGLIFNLIQMKILHSGEGHYHLGGEDHGHDHEHDNHNHDHKHDQNDHKHEHKDHDHEHDHDEEGHAHIKKDKKKVKEHKNINVESAYLHVLGDMLMSVGVIIAATMIYFNPHLAMADPICTYLFSVMICVTTIPVFKNCINVIMEATPKEINSL